MEGASRGKEDEKGPRQGGTTVTLVPPEASDISWCGSVQPSPRSPVGQPRSDKLGGIVPAHTGQPPSWATSWCGTPALGLWSCLKPWPLEPVLSCPGRSANELTAGTHWPRCCTPSGRWPSVPWATCPSPRFVPPPQRPRSPHVNGESAKLFSPCAPSPPVLS